MKGISDMNITKMKTAQQVTDKENQNELIDWTDEEIVKIVDEEISKRIEEEITKLLKGYLK